MEPLTKNEFEETHSSEGISEEDFELMAALAEDLTALLCLNRQDRDPAAARRAMKEMISYWITHRGTAGVDHPKSERMGNYSITHRENALLTVRGVAVAPGAMVILDRAGLTDRGI